MPRAKPGFPRRGITRWADKECNSARGDLSVEAVERLQAQGLSQTGIRLAMIELRRNKWEPNVNREACYD